MKKSFLILSILFISFSALSQQKSYQITGNIAGVKNNAKVYLYNLDVAPNILIDSAIVKNQIFILQGKKPLKAPMYCRLLIDMSPDEKVASAKIQKVVGCYIENAKIYLTGSIENMQDYYYNGKTPKQKLSISGSKTENTYQAYLNSSDSLRAKNSFLWGKYLEDYHRPALKAVFNTQEGINLVKQRNEIKQQIKDQAIDFIRKHNNSVASIKIAKEILYSNRSLMSCDEIDKITGLFDPSLQKFEVMKSLLAYARKMKKSAKGLRYSDISLNDSLGNKVQLSKYIEPNQYTMLEFWASWCGPCRGEIPHLKQVDSIYRSKGFKLISISIDENKANWKKALNDEQMPWLQFNDPLGWKGESNTKYQFNGVPFSVIIDNEGKIISTNIRGAELDLLLQELYSN